MANIIISPSMEKVLVNKGGWFTIPREDVGLACNCVQEPPRPCGGIPLNRIPLQFAMFERLCKEMGTRFIERQRVRGFDEAGVGLVVHGPWISRFAQVEDPETPEWKGFGKRGEDGFEHPELAAAKVYELTHASDFVDYVLVGQFAFKDKMTDLELPE